MITKLQSAWQDPLVKKQVKVGAITGGGIGLLMGGIGAIGGALVGAASGFAAGVVGYDARPPASPSSQQQGDNFAA
jgi:phosphoglycerate dehydrogenase-like enzyme